MIDKETQDKIDKTEEAFLNMKFNPDKDYYKYESVCGEMTSDGKYVLMFRRTYRPNGRVVKVYLNDKNVLMPYFGDEV